MIDYPLTVEEISSWFLSKEQQLRGRGIALAGLRQSVTAKSAVAADFDTSPAIGQVVVWVSGEVDFQVLRVSDKKDVFVRHEKVSSLGAPSFESAFDDFLRSMTRPEAMISEVA